MKKRKGQRPTSSTISHSARDAADPGTLTTNPPPPPPPPLLPLPSRCIPSASTSLGSALPPAWSTTLESETRQ